MYEMKFLSRRDISQKSFIPTYSYKPKALND